MMKFVIYRLNSEDFSRSRMRGNIIFWLNYFDRTHRDLQNHYGLGPWIVFICWEMSVQRFFSRSFSTGYKIFQGSASHHGRGEWDPVYGKCPPETVWNPELPWRSLANSAWKQTDFTLWTEFILISLWESASKVKSNHFYVMRNIKWPNESWRIIKNYKNW